MKWATRANHTRVPVVHGIDPPEKEEEIKPKTSPVVHHSVTGKGRRPRRGHSLVGIRPFPLRNGFLLPLGLHYPQTLPASYASLANRRARMAAAALREQLNALLSSMFSAGLVDEQFQQLQMLQDDGGTPGFVAEVVTLFCDDAERIITELSSLLEQPVVDFDKVDAFVHQLKGSSASVGAQKVKFTCMQFRQFCQEKSRDGCLMALAFVRNEFCDLRNKFQTMLQLEQQIQAYDPKQQ